MRPMKGKAPNRLRVLRAERDVAQEVLAHKVGIKPSRYWRIEHGLKDPTQQEVTKLARELRVPVDALGFTHIEAQAS